VIELPIDHQRCAQNERDFAWSRQHWIVLICKLVTAALPCVDLLNVDNNGRECFVRIVVPDPISKLALLCRSVVEFTCETKEEVTTVGALFRDYFTELAIDL
jgi:hypothetical protein